MKILLTGFEPFGGLTRNPSQEIIELLAQRELGTRISIHAATLKTEYERSARRIVELMEALQPEIVLSLGVAVGSDKVQLERVALNVDDCENPDNAGDLRCGQRIAADGPDAYFSTLPLHELHEALSASHPKVIISNHAGAYVCNHVFFTASHHAKNVLSHPLCGFVHVPQPGLAGPSANHWSLNQMTDIVADALLFLARKATP